MEFITEVSGLEGKTIKNASSVDCEESICLIFTDDTCAFFDVGFCGDSHDIYLNDDPGDYLKMEAGVISKSEYEALKNNEKKLREAETKQRELTQLAQLRKKYEP